MPSPTSPAASRGLAGLTSRIVAIDETTASSRILTIATIG